MAPGNPRSFAVCWGFLKPSSGNATVNGLDCYLDRVAVHAKLSYLPGDARMYRTMRAKSLLKMFAGLREGGSFDAALKVADRLELDLSRWVGLMSTGMRQKLALSICMSVEAPLLVLDEPTANLDPTVRGQVLALIKEAKLRGQTVIFSSHVLSEIEEVCDRVAILKSGKLAFQESLEDLSWKHRIRAKTDINVADHVSMLGTQEQPTIVQNDQRVLIETQGELSPVLKWLSEMPLRNVTIEPVGLRSVYDKIHCSEASGDSKAEATT